MGIDLSWEYDNVYMLYVYIIIFPTQVKVSGVFQFTSHSFSLMSCACNLHKEEHP